MSEPGGQETLEEEPLDREEVVLAQAEIKEILSSYFVGTSLKELFSEPLPQERIDSTTYRSLKRDFIGTRVVSGDLQQGVQERELQVISKLRDIKKGQVDIGQMIRLIEPGSRSDRKPTIEYLIVEAKGEGGGFRSPHPPNTRSTVNSALDLARGIVAKPSN